MKSGMKSGEHFNVPAQQHCSLHLLQRMEFVSIMTGLSQIPSVGYVAYEQNSDMDYVFHG
jgi:hypothetical protein